MQGSLQRVRDVIQGRTPDRPPLYDLLRNDAVISHFAGQRLTVENAAEVVYRAYEPAVDATRPLVRLPEHEHTVILDDGRPERHFRWTVWTPEATYADSEAYAAAKRRALGAYDPAWTAERQAALDAQLARGADDRARLGEVFYFASGPGVGLQGIFGEVGLEAFSYYLADWPDLVDALLDMQVDRTLAWIAHLPADHGLEAVFSGDDIAYNRGPFLRPAWFAQHYFARLARVTAAYHARGIKLLFHSDGNLNPILDGLVEAGIDGLNPLEVLAGMDVGEVHRRHPHLFLAGAIDVSQLLPLGRPGEVRDAVVRAIEDGGGRLMVGSSTELNDAVPLENYLALRDAVLGYTYS